MKMQMRKDKIANAVLTSLGNAKSGHGTGHYLTVDNMIKTFTPRIVKFCKGYLRGIQMCQVLVIVRGFMH